MLSTLNRLEEDPHDVIEIAPDVVLAARGDTASPAPATTAGAAPSAPEVRVAPALTPAPAVSTPSVDTTFRATTLDDIRIPGERSAFGRWAMRSLMAFTFAICSAVAAAAWQHYGDQAQRMLTDWTPPRINLTSLFASNKPAAPDQSATPIAAAASVDQAAVQTAAPQPVPTAAPQPTPATTTSQDTAAAAPAAAPAAETTQLMQSMAHNITAMSQQIADLKTSIDQLKNRQEQMSRDLAKAAEAKVAEAKAAEAKSVEMRAFERQRILPPSPRPAAPVAVRKPKPTYTPVQASAMPPPPPAPAAPLPSSQPIAPLPPPQATVQTDGESVVRPPMPVH